MKLTHSTSAVTGSHIPTIHVTAQSMAGQYHAVRSQENEDSIIKFENDSIMVVAVSDGCSESAGAKAASQASCEASVKFAKTRDVWSTDDNTLKSAFLSVIDDVYMDTKLPYNLLKATLLLLVVSKITGDYVGISIGDCSALVLDENLNKPEVLLKPYNQFMQATRTVFANNKDADALMAIVRGRVQDKAGFVLFTDGAKALLEDTYEEEVKKLVGLTAINAGEAAQTEADVLVNTFQQGGHDDVSIIAVGLENPNTVRIASTLYQPKQEEAPESEPAPAPIPMEIKAEKTEEMPAPDKPEKPAMPAAEPVQEFTAEELLKNGIIQRPSEFFVQISPFLQNSLMTYSAATGAFQFCDLSGQS
ncbi:protein phosphatase 2C domain-containing protein [uncultured Ruminococcus sp.]|uniref:protein phosphatase 2C domain-containing protein n=1 Tax=uncultured Ruminococcus sp. TaxID=165186 RepID=UPI0026587E8E|nr:protein phosphatase 2C domain-containing protein [uncultured Ruminococcus sp.]